MESPPLHGTGATAPRTRCYQLRGLPPETPSPTHTPILAPTPTRAEGCGALILHLTYLYSALPPKEKRTVLELGCNLRRNPRNAFHIIEQSECDVTTSTLAAAYALMDLRSSWTPPRAGLTPEEIRRSASVMFGPLMQLISTAAAAAAAAPAAAPPYDGGPSAAAPASCFVQAQGTDDVECEECGLRQEGRMAVSTCLGSDYPPFSDLGSVLSGRMSSAITSRRHAPQYEISRIVTSARIGITRIAQRMNVSVDIVDCALDLYSRAATAPVGGAAGSAAGCKRRILDPIYAAAIVLACRKRGFSLPHGAARRLFTGSRQRQYTHALIWFGERLPPGVYPEPLTAEDYVRPLVSAMSLGSHIGVIAQALLRSPRGSMLQRHSPVTAAAAVVYTAAQDGEAGTTPMTSVAEHAKVTSSAIRAACDTLRGMNDPDPRTIEPMFQEYNPYTAARIALSVSLCRYPYPLAVAALNEALG